MAWNPQVANQSLSIEGPPGVVIGGVVRDVTTTTLATVIEAYVCRVALDPSLSSTAGRPWAEYAVADTAKTFTASKDTYVYLTSAGALAYSEVANGAAKPTLASIVTAGGYGSQFLAKVVTDSDEITSVTDLAERNCSADLMSAEIYLSFNATEVGDYFWRAPTHCRLYVLQACVIDTLANTDVGTVTASVGVNDIYTAVTGGAISIPLSSATGTRVAVAPTAVREIAAGQSLKLVSAKATAGGSCVVQVLYGRI